MSASTGAVPILRNHDPRHVIGNARQEGSRFVLDFMPEARITREMVPADAFRVLEERDGYVVRVDLPWISVRGA